MALTDSRWCRWQGNTANHFKWDHGGEEFISYHWMEGKLQHLPIGQSRCTCTARGARRTWDLPWDPVKIVKSERIEVVKLSQTINVHVLLITPKHDRHQTNILRPNDGLGSLEIFQPEWRWSCTCLDSCPALLIVVWILLDWSGPLGFWQVLLLFRRFSRIRWCSGCLLGVFCRVMYQVANGWRWGIDPPLVRDIAAK